MSFRWPARTFAPISSTFSCEAIQDRRWTLKVETIGELGIADPRFDTKSFHLQLQSALVPAHGVMVE